MDVYSAVFMFLCLGIVAFSACRMRGEYDSEVIIALIVFAALSAMAVIKIPNIFLGAICLVFVALMLRVPKPAIVVALIILAILLLTNSNGISNIWEAVVRHWYGG